MTEFIIKSFIKNYEDTSNPQVREKYGTLSSVIGIFVNAIVSLAKLIFGLLCASMAMIADALNNMSDAGSSLVSLVSFKMSGKPADRDHPFGHARIEYIASMIVSFLILIVGFEMFTDSINILIGKGEASKVNFDIFSLVVLLISIIVKLWLGVFYRLVGKKIDSSVIKASSTDSFMDCISTTTVLVSAIIVKLTGFILLDAIVGLGVSILIFVAGINILNETKNSILGEAPKAEILQEIKEIISRYPEVVGIHDLLLHNYGPNNYITSFHAEVDGNQDIFVLHDMIDNLERAIATELGIICTVHLDPIVTDDETVAALKEFVRDIVHTSVGDNVEIHDFRVVIGETHTNLIFDIELPFEIREPLDKIVEKIQNAVLAVKSNHFCVITIDRA